MSDQTIRGWVGAGEKGVSFTPVSGKFPVFVNASDAVRETIRAGLWTDGVKTHVMAPEVPVRLFEPITMSDGSPGYRLRLTDPTILTEFLALCKAARREKSTGVDTTAADEVVENHSW
jgi:hypothetical protein